MWALAAVLKPFVLFVFAACVLYPARLAVMRYWPEGRLKRVLLFRREVVVGFLGGSHEPRLASFVTGHCAACSRVPPVAAPP